MENASKALIIAGAILLAILLISLGIMIYNQAQDTVSNSGMDQASTTAFNNQFIKYEGKQKGTMVKSLIQEVLASNSDATAGNDAKVKMIINGATETENPTTSGIVNSNLYDVKVSGYNGGRISQITVSDATGGAGGATP